MEDEWIPKRFLIGNFVIETSGKTKNKMGGRRPEGHITALRNTRMEKTSRRQRRMEVSSEGDQGPGGGPSAVDKMEINRNYGLGFRSAVTERKGYTLAKISVHRRAFGFKLNFRHRAFSILGQAFRYSPENAFYIFNQQIYFIIWYLLDRASLI